MSLELRRRIFDELDSVVLIDPHTHINPLSPASSNLADILGYHYYTELAHSAGMPKDQIEELGLPPREKVARLIENLGPISNTVQYSWFQEIAQKLLGFEGEAVTAANWEGVYDAAESLMAEPDWATQVLQKSKLEAVFLTNDFDDPLEGFDTATYIPCLRTDDLVFHLPKPQVRERLEMASGVTLSDARSLRRAIEQLFRKFKAKGARACAISLPPDFTPAKVSLNRANVALDAILRNGVESFDSHRKALSNFIFWTLAEFCDYYRLPFDLMIGVNRNVYEEGVHQGRDLYDSRTSLIQYKDLFNAFPNVTFPVSVLASVTNQELVSYAWIFPNVVTSGHWWYSNTPAYIEPDLAARLEAVPRNKQIGYYSDMYKLEFALPKFGMYKRTLSKVLAEQFVLERGWSETQAVDLGKQVLRGNVESVFRFAENPADWIPEEVEMAPPPEYVPPTRYDDGGMMPAGALNEFGLPPSLGESSKVLGSRAMQDSDNFIPGALAMGMAGAAAAGLAAPTFGAISEGSSTLGIAPGETVITPPTDEGEFDFLAADHPAEELPAEMWRPTAGAAGEVVIQPTDSLDALPLDEMPLDELQPLDAELPLEELTMDDLGTDDQPAVVSPFAPTAATLVPPAYEEPPAAWPIPTEPAEVETLEVEAFDLETVPAPEAANEEEVFELDLNALEEEPAASGEQGGIGLSAPSEAPEEIVALDELIVPDEVTPDEEIKLDDVAGEEGLKLDDLDMEELSVEEAAPVDLDAIDVPDPTPAAGPAFNIPDAAEAKKSDDLNWDFLK